MNTRVLLAVTLFLGAVPLSDAVNPGQGNALVAMNTYVVEASSAPAFLELGFRHHMIWAGIKTLTFKSVPAAWAKAGIKIGDRVIAIDGKVVDGMTLRKDLFPLLEAKFAPLRKKTTDSVSFQFTLQPREPIPTRTIKVILKANNAFTIGT